VNGLHSNAVEPTLEILAMVEHEIDVIDNLVTKSCSDTRVCIKFDSEVLRQIFRAVPHKANICIWMNIIISPVISLKLKNDDTNLKP